MSATDPAERSFLGRLSRAWGLISLGFICGAAGTCLFLRSEIEAISLLRVIQFKIFWMCILGAAFIPPLIFEAIEGIRAWLNLRKRTAEQVVPPNRSLPPSQNSKSSVRDSED